MAEYYTVVTDIGFELLNDCLITQKIFPGYKMAVGDSNGVYYEPEKTQTALKNQKYITNVAQKGKKGNYIFFNMQIPPSEGDYTIREVGLFDKENNLLAVAKYPETLKQKTSGSSNKTIMIEIQIELSDSAINNIIIDDSGNLATEEELSEYQKRDEKGKANGYAPLNASNKIPLEHFSVATYNTAGAVSVDQDTMEVDENGKIKAKSIIASENKLGNIKSDNKTTFLDADGTLHSPKYNLFDLIQKDHILTFEEKEGLELLGEYVYKESQDGRRGYSDFYETCLKEYKEAEKEDNINTPIIGDLVINNGVISGFSLNSYAILPERFIHSGKTWEVVIKIRTGQDVTKANAIIGSNTNNWDPICCRIENSHFILYPAKEKANIGYVTGTYTVLPETDYWVKITFNGSEYKLEYSLNGKTYSVDITIKSTETVNDIEGICLGGESVSTGGNIRSPFLGSIDLKESYINIDGKRWWTGAEITTIKVHKNGHKYYNISDKAKIDEIYQNTGVAWYYGIDEEKERILLPRFDTIYLNSKTKIPVIGSGYPLKLTPDGTNLYFLTTHHPNGHITAAIPVKTESKNPSLADWETSKFTDAMTSESFCKPLGVEAASSDPKQSGLLADLSTNKENPYYIYMVVGNTTIKQAVTEITEVTTSENDTIPLGVSMYSPEVLESNAGWVKSEGSWLNGNIYETFYNKAKIKIGQAFGAGFIKESTDSYDDYDLVINQEENTFRLPFMNGSETLTNNKYEPVELKSDGSTYIAPYNGWFSLSGLGSNVRIWNQGSGSIGDSYPIAQNGIVNISVFCKKGDKIQLQYATMDITSVVWGHLRWIKAKGNGGLYFKLGNALENQQLIDCSKVIEELNSKVNLKEAAHSAMPSSNYVELDAGASSTSHTAPADGWFAIRAKITQANGFVTLIRSGTQVSLETMTHTPVVGQMASCILPARKGDNVKVYYHQADKPDGESGSYFRFIYAEGSK